ncbi:NAC domain-containing protein 35-like [Dioscorea cayenensis subsp. rotundata]|uniref:NAC domain-containing protein 35-like n=1 Tax=Dioscorea cayennensis subsp. rotundata TaxID=55577 RepID=A0AB40B8E3_DIOCR|nr:NAC domain-containing protein 35-like [Dioscorea cayenensis subsp. rotundata]
MALQLAFHGEVQDHHAEDNHQDDLLMPGFRFHPTDEELIDFYLRRKLEGKSFIIDFIPFINLYSYDPWDLPAWGIIGDKEWYFYVPRDRKYRSGDRPNRVTNSGYWKATGADRKIKAENSREIGLKRTLVFYTGKAPKGSRTSWIMHEYRLLKIKTDQLHKVELSLCRVYKRAGENSQCSDTVSTKVSQSTRSASSKRYKLSSTTFGSCSSSLDSEKFVWHKNNNFIEASTTTTTSQAPSMGDNMTHFFDSESRSDHCIDELGSLVGFYNQSLPKGEII